MTEDHLKITATDRGFVHMPPVRSTYGGEVRAYESSAASGPHVWLAIDGATAHLEAIEAWRLAEQIMMLVINHYQGDARPERRVADVLDAIPVTER